MKPRRMSLAVTLAVAIPGLVFAPLAASPAFATATPTTFTSDKTTYAPGDALTLTVIPGDSGVLDICGSANTFAHPTDTSSNTDPGFSIEAMLYDQAVGSDAWLAFPGTPTAPKTQYAWHSTFDTAGVGSFTPSTHTGNIVVNTTIPADAPDGDYLLWGGCMSPNLTIYDGNYSAADVHGIPISIVTASDSGSGGESSGGDSSVGSSLPRTGLESVTSVAFGFGAITVLGALLLIVALRRRRNSGV